MDYIIVGIILFIVGFVAGFILHQMMVKNDKERVILNEMEIKEMAKKNADVELKKIKEKLSKGTKEKDRDDIIKGIDNYFTLYGNPYDNGNGK